MNRIMLWWTLRQLKSKDWVERLVAALKDTNSDVREAAAKALGKTGDVRSVNPLSTSLRNDILPVRLACYSALKQIGINISETEVQELVESVATEIRRLYSTRRVEVGYEMVGQSSSGGKYEEIYREGPDPDIDGIRHLIALIPTTLRERVRALSGEAQDLF